MTNNKLSKLVAQLNNEEHGAGGWFGVTECPSGGFYLLCDDMQVVWASTQAELELKIAGDDA